MLYRLKACNRLDTGRFAPKSFRPVVSPQALGRFAPTKVVSPPVVSLRVEVVSPPVNSRKKNGVIHPDSNQSSIVEYELCYMRC